MTYVLYIVCSCLRLSNSLSLSPLSLSLLSLSLSLLFLLPAHLSPSLLLSHLIFINPFLYITFTLSIVLHFIFFYHTRAPSNTSSLSFLSSLISTNPVVTFKSLFNIFFLRLGKQQGWHRWFSQLKCLQETLFPLLSSLTLRSSCLHLIL